MICYIIFDNFFSSSNQAEGESTVYCLKYVSIKNCEYLERKKFY